jgi:ferredoxin
VVLDDRGFTALVTAILAGYRTVAPTLRDATITLAEIASAGDLAKGVTLEQAPGSCRVVDLPDGDTRRFAWAVGPHSAKSRQHPPDRTLFIAELDTTGFSVTSGEGAPPVSRTDGAPGGPPAIIGLRPCDVAAVGVLERVLGADATGGFDPLVVVVNCAEPGGTCFCASMDTGPALDVDRSDRADLVLWERGTASGPEYLVVATSERGGTLLEGIEQRPAEQLDLAWAEASTSDAAARMGRRLETVGLAEGLLATLDSARWDDVAARCLSCGNCTMVCPTCFCSSVHDESSLDGSTVSRVQRWDSCFTLEHSFIHGGSVRNSTADRYRQWLTHKLSTWWGQFGESGCVGCGRCIAWCPVGIDLTEEANALLGEAHAGETRTGSAPAPEWSVTDVLVQRRAAAMSGAAGGGERA